MRKKRNTRGSQKRKEGNTKKTSRCQKKRVRALSRTKGNGRQGSPNINLVIQHGGKKNRVGAENHQLGWMNSNGTGGGKRSKVEGKVRFLNRG